MPSEFAPPPIYSQDDPGEVARSDHDTPLSTVPQIMIVPSSDTTNFQKGYVGADGERAAIEGELQVKGTAEGDWIQVTIALRTIEKAYHNEIELACTEVILFSASSESAATLPCSFPFAIPLTEDIPQCIHTPLSSISHVLTATLHPADPLSPKVSRSLTVHTRRFTSHSYVVPIAPETHSIGNPTRVEVEIPRTTFKVGESIPIYITVPPPDRDLVVKQGLRLRNVRAEFVRTVRVRREDSEESDSDADSMPEAHEKYPFSTSEGPSTAATSAAVENLSQPSTSKWPHSPLSLGSSYKTVVSRSGASCRFHSSRPIRLRFVLHLPSPSASPSDYQSTLPIADHGHLDTVTDCASITQTTLLHTVSFRLNIHVSFVDMSSRREQFSAIHIPILIIAPAAPLPEVEGWVDAAYQKKHDRPPAKTTRVEDVEMSAPNYEGEAGTSAQAVGAPPPFEERDAPPPFWVSEPQASTSNRLPTFLESEREIFIPPGTSESMQHSLAFSPTIIGEGSLFGFTPSEQFDGHSEGTEHRSMTPPPSLEMAARDANVTQLAGLHEPERTIEALGLVLEQRDEATMNGDILPPPPPAMDDPSDPPPSIDSEFRSPGTPPQQVSHPHTPSPAPPFGQPVDQSSITHTTPLATSPGRASHGHAPPPYLVPEEGETDQGHVMRPPPYMDLIPSRTELR